MGKNNKKKSYDEVYVVYKNKGYTLLDTEYINNLTKMTCIDSEGYLYDVNYSNIIKEGYKVSKFHSGNKHTIDNIKLFIKLNRKTVGLISDKYHGSKNKLIFKCLIHDREFSMSWDNFSVGKGCKLCGIESVSKSLSLTIEDIRLKFKEINRPNTELISHHYVNSKTDLEFRCLKHNENFKCNWNVFQVGAGCKICASEQRSLDRAFTIEYITNRFNEINNKKIELISKTYVNNSKKLIFKCLVHNKEFLMSWNEFLQGQGCKQCSIDSRSGENSYQWKGGITNLSDYLRNKIQPWKVDSFKKYNRMCDITSSKDDCIIHHLHPFASIVKETMSILNLPIHKEINKYTNEELKSIEKLCLELHYKYGLGVCLTDEIHDEFHKIYKYNGDTNLEQYLEFKARKQRELNIITQ